MSRTNYIQNGDGLIMINAYLNTDTEVLMVFDTGATHTTLDINSIAFLGFDFGKRLDSVMIETGNGIVMTDRYVLNQFDALGISKKDYIVQVYDFLAHGVLSEYDGILGLDFLEGYHFCIDTLKEEITIQE